MMIPTRSPLPLLFLLYLLAFTHSRPTPPEGSVNNEIVIGILDQPIVAKDECDLRGLGSKYIVASYVKLIESVGARVVPIPFDAPKSHLEKLFNSVNGILIPGGDTDFTPGTTFYDQAKYLYTLAVEATDAGDYFPLFGICQGMEMLAVMMANSNCEVLDFDYEARDISMPLDFTTEAENSLLFGSMPSTVYENLQKNNVTFNVHSNGLPLDGFQSGPLAEMAIPLATNKDEEGKRFVSVFEGKKYPIFGMQFHPSRLAYEWTPGEDMDHSTQAVLDMQYLAYRMYNQARFNKHQFSREDLQQAVIYNTVPYFTEPVCPMFEQTYVWPDFQSAHPHTNFANLRKFPTVEADEL